RGAYGRVKPDAMGRWSHEPTRDRLAPLAGEEGLAVKGDLELDLEVEVVGVAGLPRSCPDIHVRAVLSPTQDDIGLVARAGRVGVPRGQRHRLGAVEAAPVVEDVLAALMDRHRRRALDHVLGDLPDGVTRQSI